MVEEARPGQSALPVANVDRARPEREQPPDEVHRLVDRGRRRIRPEVAAAVLDELPRPLDPREVVGHRDLDVRVALVVLEPDVEPRPEPLDQVRLEEERLADRVGQGVLDVDDLVDDGPNAVALERPQPRPLLPVAPDAAAEALRLADVHDVASGVAHEVDAGSIGQLLEGRLELGSHASDRTGNHGDQLRGSRDDRQHGRRILTAASRPDVRMGPSRKGGIE